MTDPKPEIAVTQADRQAAADWMRADGCPWSSVYIEDTLAGANDDGGLVQAFAAHRLATEKAIVEYLREKALEYRELQRGYDQLSHGHILYGDLDRETHAIADAVASGACRTLT